MKPLVRLLTAAAWVLLLAPGPLAASALVDQGRQAEAAENYQRALELYRQALAADPLDGEAPLALGRLYDSQGLHDLALPAWQEAVRRNPGRPDVWISLGQAYSYLDRNDDALRALTEASGLFPADPALTQGVAWLSFKLEAYRAGIEAIDRFEAAQGRDRDLEMTLGTLYSGLYDYDRARIHYLQSITLAPGQDDDARNFRAIAWYNLSLLEKDFRQFELSEESIRRSLDEEDRPAGHLALGELYQGQAAWSEARRQFQQAAEADETPLSRYDLARLEADAGRYDEAEAQIREVEHHKDRTWLYNYGVTREKLERDLHEVRADLHRGRFFALDFTPPSSFLEWLTWVGAKVREAALWWYHDQTWKLSLGRLADASQRARNSPEAWVDLTRALRDRPVLALKYLDLVRRHEVPRNPRAQASYLVEEGSLSRDPEPLTRALDQLQTPWENDDRIQALKVLSEVRRSQGRAAEARRLTAELYRLTPGSLPGNGRALPVTWRLSAADEASRAGWTAALQAWAAQTGWDASAADRPGVTWTLDLRVGPDQAVWALRDDEGRVFRQGVVRRPPADRAAGVAEVFWGVHRAEP